MKKVAKYNLFKGVSTLLTLGTPIATLACCGEFFVHRSDTAMSAAAIFVILIVAIFCKDKILENWKTPPAAVICLIMFILICLVETILYPIKTVCITTMIATGVDEFTFKRMYKETEALLPEKSSIFKHCGFLFTTTKKLEGDL